MCVYAYVCSNRRDNIRSKAVIRNLTNKSEWKQIKWTERGVINTVNQNQVGKRRWISHATGCELWEIKGRPEIRVMGNTVQIPGSWQWQRPLFSVTLTVSVILDVCLLYHWILAGLLTPSHLSNLFTRSGVPYNATNEHSLFCTKLLSCFSSSLF